MGKFRKSSHTKTERWKGQHRFEHWYRDNTVYFITSKVREGFRAFRSEEAKAVFWDRFRHWTSHYEFFPWVTTLLDNHYHTVGYLRTGENLGPMMQKLHGSVAKLVNDILERESTPRHKPFWRFAGNQDYYDGCLRDRDQVVRSYNYTLRQAVRAGLVRKPDDYAHTRIQIPLARGLPRAEELKAIPIPVPYARYLRRKTPTRPE